MIGIFIYILGSVFKYMNMVVFISNDNKNRGVDGYHSNIDCVVM